MFFKNLEQYLYNFNEKVLIEIIYTRLLEIVDFSKLPLQRPPLDLFFKNNFKII